MEESKRYSKLKIFLFLFFAVIAIIFATQVYRIIGIGTIAIQEKNKEIMCDRFRIEEIIYLEKEKSLIFTAMSTDYNSNISSITVIPDVSGIKHSVELSPTLAGGQSRILRINNISIGEEFYAFIEDCKEKGVTGSIRQ